MELLIEGKAPVIPIVAGAVAAIALGYLLHRHLRGLRKRMRIHPYTDNFDPQDPNGHGGAALGGADAQGTAALLGGDHQGLMMEVSNPAFGLGQPAGGTPTALLLPRRGVDGGGGILRGGGPVMEYGPAMRAFTPALPPSEPSEQGEYEEPPPPPPRPCWKEGESGGLRLSSTASAEADAVMPLGPLPLSSGPRPRSSGARRPPGGARRSAERSMSPAASSPSPSFANGSSGGGGVWGAPPSPASLQPQPPTVTGGVQRAQLDA